MDLENCPFCGTPSQVYNTEPRNDLKGGFLTEYFVRCGNPGCGGMGPVLTDKSKAVACWNRRTISSSQFEAQLPPEMKAFLGGMRGMLGNMMNKDFIKKRIDALKEECEKFGVEMGSRPMPEVLLELRDKKKAAGAT